MGGELLRKNILQTLAYFDIFGYALTREEICRYLYTTDPSTSFGSTQDKSLRTSFVNTDFTDFLNQLAGFTNKDGFYFLLGREENVATRQRAVKWFEQKMKIARRAVKKLRWIPFLRAVFVCNTLSGAGLTEGSDIDVFVVVRKGRLWLARFLATLALSVWGLRRTKRKIKDKVCLSFYVTDDSLNLSKIALNNDIYLMYWLAQLIPLYDPDNLYLSVQRANQWARQSLPNAFVPHELSERLRVSSGKISKFVKNLLEKMWGGAYGDLMEKQAKEAQKVRMKLNYMSVQNEPDTRVVVNDQMLKFHENDRRSEYRDRWQEKCKLLNC